MNNMLSQVDLLMNQTCNQLQRGSVVEAIDKLCLGLNRVRQNIVSDDWNCIVAKHCFQHKLRALLHQDPYTRRAYEKPRGYAGDAVMLDYIYSAIPPRNTTSLGKKIFQATIDTPNGRSVIERRDRLAGIIDRICNQQKKPRILSLACGHLREAQLSQTVHSKKFDCYVAMDQDADSLAVVEVEQGDKGVQIMHSSINSLLRGKVVLPQFDLIYSTGLFDYLSDRVATKLISLMINKLTPAGKLVVTNFTPKSHGRGYMDIYMDWRLIYRTTQHLEALVDKTTVTVPIRIQISQDSYDNIAYLEVTKS